MISAQYKGKLAHLLPVTFFNCQCAQGPVSEYMCTPEQAAGLNAKAGHKVDLEALAQAHVNAIAGACLAMGIKFAGSANSGARTVLTEMLHYLLAAKNDAPDSAAGD